MKAVTVNKAVNDQPNCVGLGPSLLRCFGPLRRRYKPRSRTVVKYYMVILLSLLTACATSQNVSYTYNPENLSRNLLSTIQTPKGAMLERKNVFRVTIFSVRDLERNQDAIPIPSFMANDKHEVTLAPGTYLFHIQCNNTDMSFPVSQAAKVKDGLSYVVYCEPVTKEKSFLGLVSVTGMNAVIVEKNGY